MRRGLSVVALLLAMGCASGRARVPPIVIGPDERPEAELFAAVLAASDALGYPPHRPDAARGVFAVAARTGAFRADPAVIGVRCFAGGWIQVGVIGRSTRRDGDAYDVPALLRVEVEDYGIGLRERLRRLP